MKLTTGQTIRIRLLGTEEWCLGRVARVSPNGVSVIFELDGLVRASGGLIGNVLPVSIDYEAETVTGLFGDEYEVDVQMTKDEHDLIVATLIRAGNCPYGRLQPGETIAHCPSGFPGCACGDELMVNPYLSDQPKPALVSIDVFEDYCLRHADTIFVRHRADRKWSNIALSTLPTTKQKAWIKRWFDKRTNAPKD